MGNITKMLGVDYGLARTGLAVSDDLGMFAHAIDFIKSYNIEKTAELIVEKAKELNISTIVIGRPRNMNGTDGEKVESVKKLGELIQNLCDIPIVFFDERLTTVLAHSYLRNSGIKTKNHRTQVDSLSAEIILQDYIDMKKNKMEI